MTGYANNKSLMTHSRMSCYKDCPRKCQLRYEIGLRPDVDAQPLRLGGAVHLGLDHWFRTGDDAGALEVATAGYKDPPGWVQDEETMTDWLVESAKVYGLLYGYMSYWPMDAWEVLECEQVMQGKIVNPDTGYPTNIHTAGGKIDMIVRLADGRIAVVDHKTTVNSFDDDSELWQWLRIADQFSQYWMLAEQNGYEIDTIIYDGIRKPSIRLRKGESPKEYLERLCKDVVDRPLFYYARRDMPRLKVDIDDYTKDLWSTAKQIRHSQNNDFWPRNTNECLRMGKCEYFKICTGDHGLENGPPPGYAITDKIHPELTEESEA